MIDTVLQLDRLSLRLQNHRTITPILQNISFTLPQQGTLGIVGQSGSGKSMTMRAICGLLPEKNTHISGKISLQKQHNILTIPIRDRQLYCSANIALIMQDSIHALNPYMKIKDQLWETFHFHHRHLQHHVIWEKIHQGLDNVGLAVSKKLLNQYPNQLSGGMRQRIAITLALASQAKIIIADEPTTSLDAIHQKQFIDLLKTLCEQQQLSLIFITHNLSLVSYLCQHVVVMKQGQVIEKGLVRQVFSAPEQPYTAELLNYTKKLLG